MSGIRMDGVTVRLGDRLALDGVTLDLGERRTAVIGANGSGKSTFARLVGGLVTADAGAVSVLGIDPARHAAELRRRVGFVFSNPDAQIIMPTVAEDVAFSLRGDRRSRAETAATVAAALDRFGLGELADRAAHDLSGGQKQLLALCSALIRQPSLVIADEPTAYLDARNARLISDHLLDDDGDGDDADTDDRRLLLVTHDLRLAERCDAAVLFDDGRVVASGSPADVIARYEALLSC